MWPMVSLDEREGEASGLQEDAQGIIMEEMGRERKVPVCSQCRMQASILTSMMQDIRSLRLDQSSLPLR